MKVAVYCRVSSEDQRERETIATQRDFAERYCALHDIRIHDFYLDDGVSGTLSMEQRSEGARLLTDAKAGRFTTVLVKKVNRLGRDTRHILNALAELESYGVQVKSMEEPLDTSEPAGRLFFTMLSGFAEFDRNNILKQSMEGAERAARNGGWLGGLPPYGYRVVGEKRNARLVIAEDTIPDIGLSEADVVRLIFRVAVEERVSCRVIADRLNQQGIPTAYYSAGIAHRKSRSGRPASGLWSPARVRNILTSTVYKGIHQYGKRDARGQTGREVIEREVPAIVGVEVWERAQEVLRKNLVFSSRNAKRCYLLRGLIKCGVCGLTYVGTAGSDGRIYYRCIARDQRRGIYGARGCKCPSKGIAAREIEAVVWSDIEGFLRDPGDVIRALTARMRGQETDAATFRDEAAEARQTLQGLTKERDTVLTLFRKNRIDEDVLDHQLDLIQQEERELKDRIETLEERARGAEAASAQLQSVEGLLRQLHLRLDRPVTWGLKRELVEMLVAGIRVDTVDRDGTPDAEVHLNYRFDPIATSSGCR